MNRWVEEQTREKIKDLFQPGSLTAAMRMVLVNAVYFQGNWTYQFSPALTRADHEFKGVQSTKKASVVAVNILLVIDIASTY